MCTSFCNYLNLLLHFVFILLRKIWKLENNSEGKKYDLQAYSILNNIGKCLKKLYCNQSLTRFKQVYYAFDCQIKTKNQI